MDAVLPMKKKRILFNFEPPEDVVAILAAAEKATGADRTTLIIEAIRTDLPNVVQRIIEQRREAAIEFFRLEKVSYAHGADKQKKKAG